VFAGVIDAHPIAVPNSEAARRREAGIVKVLLDAGGTSIAEFGGPPVAKGLCSSRDEQTTPHDD
jgi:hypothetical protein